MLKLLKTCPGSPPSSALSIAGNSLLCSLNVFVVFVHTLTQIGESAALGSRWHCWNDTLRLFLLAFLPSHTWALQGKNTCQIQDPYYMVNNWAVNFLFGEEEKLSSYQGHQGGGNQSLSDDGNKEMHCLENFKSVINGLKICLLFIHTER